MPWDIKVWHEDGSARVRLCVEANVEVPADVVSTLAAAYWMEEVQYEEDEWEEEPAPSPGTPGRDRLHG